MIWHVLNNCSEVEPYIKLYKEQLEKESSHDMEKRLENKFPSWFKNHIAELRCVKKDDVSDDLYALSYQSNQRLQIFSACIVDGVWYHTLDHEKIEKHKIVESWFEVHIMVNI